MQFPADILFLKWKIIKSLFNEVNILINVANVLFVLCILTIVNGAKNVIGRAYNQQKQCDTK